MNIWVVVIIIAVVSVILSLTGLKNLNNKSHLREVKKKLLKGRVIFHRV